MKSPKYNLPWITQKIPRMCRKKQRLFNKAKRSRKSKDWNAYKALKNDTNKALRRAHCIGNTLITSYWRDFNLRIVNLLGAMSNLSARTQGVAPLKSKGNLFSDSKSTATILNDQFKSVFSPTQDPDSDIPLLEGPNYPSIVPLIISSKGVEKLLSKLNLKKASGPDNISCRILRELSAELAPVLSGIFTQSIESGEVPHDWTQTLVTTIFKNRHLAENYRPESLTSVRCKILEHISCSHVRDHLDRHNILSTLQHGFRERHSCKSQLLTTLQDLLSLHNRGVQVD